MNVGVIMWPIEAWPAMAERWRRAERLGFHTGWLYDHLAWRGHTPWDDAYASLAAAAAITSRMRLGTLVTSPNFRHPVPTAQAAKTIDRISNGRLTLGIGAGSKRRGSDGEVLDEEWTPRVRADRFAEWVSQLDALLTESPVSLKGAHWSAREATIAPGLVQQRPPFFIAGDGPRGMRLAARYGQAWICNPRSPDAPALPFVRSQIAKIDEVCAEEGRPPLPKLMLTGFAADRWLDSLAAFEDLYGTYTEEGITDLAVHWPRPGTALDADMKVFEDIAGYCASR